MKKMNSYIALSTLALSVMGTSSLYAGEIKVINENKKELELHIKAQGAMTEKLTSYIQHIPAEHQYEFSVNRENLNGKSTYSIEGKTNIFLGDTCKNLSVDNDYQLTFTNNTIGTTCLAHEIKK